MPHLVLEYSSNLQQKPTVETLRHLHYKLPTFGPFELPAIKSRLIERSVFCVGGERNNSAFLHLELALLTGRDATTKKSVSEQLLSELKEIFGNASQEISITVEIREMMADCYSKFSTVS